MTLFEGIPGVQRIKQTHQPLSRLCWVAVIVACATSGIVITVDRIRLYLGEPVIYLYKYERRDFVQFPSVTICPLPAFDEEVMAQRVQDTRLRNHTISVYDLVPNTSLEDIWKKGAEDIDDFLTACYYAGFKDCGNTSMWTQQLTASGPCYTITITETMPVDLNPTIVFRVNDSWCPPRLCPYVHSLSSKWRLIVHDYNEVLSYKSLTHGQIIAPGVSCVATYDRTYHYHQQSSKRPCQSFTAYMACKTHCLDVEMLKRSGCRLPFMRTPGVVEQPLCNTSADFFHAYPKPFQLHSKTPSLLKQKCGCRRPCEHSSFKISFDSWASTDAGITKISVRPSNPFGQTITSEEFSYGFLKLLCDIGAILGMHMAISLLTLTEFLEFLYGTLIA